MAHDVPELTEKKLYQAMMKIGEEAKPEIQQGIKTFMDNVFKKGMAPKDALGLKDDMLEGLYGHAYQLFNNGRYDDALMVFRLLVVLNSMEPKYSMGIAACLHMKKDYEAAADMYGICSVLDPENPIPAYHASDCWMKLRKHSLASSNLNTAIERAGSKPQYALIKDRCLMARRSLPEEPVEAEPKQKG